MPSDPTMPDVPRPPQGPSGGYYPGRPVPGMPPGPPGFVPPPTRASSGGAGFVGVAIVGALVAAVVVAAGSYVVDQLLVQGGHVGPFVRALGMAPWPWHHGYGALQGKLFLVDLGGVLVVTFVLLLLVTRPAPGGRRWFTVFFASWAVQMVAAGASHVAATKLAGYDRFLGGQWAYQVLDLALMWALVAGWLPAAITATANAMRRTWPPR